MVGDKKSSCHSPFAVFETLKGWTTTRATKVIPDGTYFAVLVRQDGGNVDVHPNLFVQGYRPHRSFAKLYVDKRRYGRFVKGEVTKLSGDDDVAFAEAQLYQVVGEREVRLVQKDGESHDEGKMLELAEHICCEQGLELLGELQLAEYSCPISSGYFLAGYSYKVWVAVVGLQEHLKLTKKALIFDYDTGIPGLVECNEDHFLVIE